MKKHITISCIGNSITSDFYVSSWPRMLVKMWSKQENNWFVNKERKNKINSIYERINKKIPATFLLYGAPGAAISVKGNSLIDYIINRRHFFRQVNELIRNNNFPDLIFFWGGHDALDWTRHLGLTNKQLCSKFKRDLEVELRKICEAAIKQNKKVSVLAPSFLNLKPYLKIRDLIYEKKKKNEMIFPYFEEAIESYKAVNRINSKRTSDLVLEMNKVIKNTVLYLQKHYKSKNNLKISFIDLSSRTKTYSINSVHPQDGFHLSFEGHRRIAAIMYPEVRKQLHFLGYKI